MKSPGSIAIPRDTAAHLLSIAVRYALGRRGAIAETTREHVKAIGPHLGQEKQHELYYRIINHKDFIDAADKKAWHDAATSLKR